MRRQQLSGTGVLHFEYGSVTQQVPKNISEPPSEDRRRHTAA